MRDPRAGGCLRRSAGAHRLDPEAHGLSGAAGSEPLHLVEPTLADATGHCFSFVESFCRAAEGRPITVWADRNAAVPLPENVALRRHFRRRLRRLQAWWLYRALLRQPGRIFVSTGGRADLALLDLAARGRIPPHKVVLYVHWLRDAPRKARALARHAARQPEIAILAPTETVAAPFRAAGFPHVHCVPYPVARAREAAPPAPAFRHVLFAGAARSDKGFEAVVDFVALLARGGRHVPVCVQTSPQHYEKMDAPSAAALKRLEAIGYPHLTRVPATLPPEAYRALFRGAICLQPYSRTDFADRVSGVTLDALNGGSPIVTLSGTWMARIVEAYGAGIVVDTPEPAALLEAVTRMIADYPGYHRRAWDAGGELRERNDARLLVQAVTA